MTEFWNSEITEASWKRLQELSKEIKFTLIGGWAVYLYTKMQKSKDIDIVIDYSTLRELSGSYKLDKNDRLRKYEIKQETFNIDIYLPSYSALTLPPSTLLERYACKVEGFTVPVPEALMALKIGAAMDRHASQKGRKDMIDIVGLLFYSGIDIGKLSALAVENKLEGHMRFLYETLNAFDMNDIRYLNLNEPAYSKLKKTYLERIRRFL